MGQQLEYLAKRDWLTEGQIWRPPDTIILRDEAKAPIASTGMTSMLLTLYDLMSPAYALVNAVEQVDVRNTRSCTINTSGVFVLTLLPTDTAILVPSRAYEMRRALVEYTWASGAKADALEVTFVVRNLHRRPYVAP